MGIFRDITKSLKEAAPIIGAGIGMYYGGAWGAALGSGLASSATGRSTEESLKNAALAGGTAYAIGGQGTMGGRGENFNTANSPFATNTTNVGSGIKKVSAGSTDTASTGMFDKALNFAKENKGLTLAGLGSLAALGAGEEKASDQKNGFSDYVGQTRLGVVPYKGTIYDLDNESERAAYFQKRQEEALKTPIYAAGGGEVNGSGTGTSDSVPARLSDGEFVVTADAVRGAGGGDRNVGAARMYDMMSQLERAA